MQSTSFISCYRSSSKVLQPEAIVRNNKRVPVQTVVELEDAELRTDVTMKKIKNDAEERLVRDQIKRKGQVLASSSVSVIAESKRCKVVIDESFSSDDEEELDVESPEVSRKRERDENQELGDLVEKMEKISMQTHEVLNLVGEPAGLLTLFKKSIAVELDPEASLDMSDDEFVRLTSRCPKFSNLTIYQSKQISDAGVIRALMGRVGMYAVSISACPKVTDWTLTALSANCPNLAKLSIVRCPITDEGIEAVASKCNDLRVVNVDWCHNLSDRSLLALGRSCPNLREFTTSECSEYTLKGFKALLAGCQKLEKLELWNCCQVDDDWMKALIESKCPIKELDVTGCSQISEKYFNLLRDRLKPLA